MTGSSVLAVNIGNGIARRLFIYIFFFMWAVAFVLGLVNYSGASINYIVFSLVFLALLISGIKQILSYGYMYVTIFLWLGFWLKMTVHFIFKYPFVEAVGIFHGTPAEWDGVLFIASIAALGVLLANYLLRHLKIQVNMRGRVTESIVPGWYSKNRHVFKVILLIPLIAIPALNIALGIHQIGVVPEHILLWPLNAVISWLITIGLAMGVATVVWWEICLGKGVKASLMLIIIEAFSSSVSVMSRGLYLFHAIPQVVALSLLGREHCDAIASHGGTPILIDLNQSVLNVQIEQIKKKYDIDARGYTVNITDEGEIEKFNMELKKYLTILSSIEGQYRAPIDFILPEYIGDRWMFSLMIL